MANVIITWRCQQNCPYCFARGMACNQNRDMNIGSFKRVLSFLKKSDEKTARLMGGEPTLHPRFKSFINLIIESGLVPHIFTNGLFPRPLLRYFLGLKIPARFSFNVNLEKTYTERQWETIRRNSSQLAGRQRVVYGRVIEKPGVDIGDLIRLALETGVKVIMLRPMNPGLNNKKPRVSEDNKTAKTVVKMVRQAANKDIRVGFGCGFAQSMFTAAQLAELKRREVANLRWGCAANSGRFDILPDLSVIRCFPLADNKINFERLANGLSAEKYFQKNIFARLRLAGKEKLGPCAAASAMNMGKSVTVGKKK